MMPQLGVLSTVHEQAATEVFERDCLIRLGACSRRSARGRPGQPCVHGGSSRPTGSRSMDRRGARSGTWRCCRCPPTARARAASRSPERGFDVGAGKGKPLEARSAAASSDSSSTRAAAGRSRCPTDAAERIEKLRAWNAALDVYPREI